MANVTINQLNNINAILPTSEIAISNDQDTNRLNIDSLRNFILGIGTNDNFDILSRLNNLENPQVDESSRMHLYNKDDNWWYPNVGKINGELTVTQTADKISIRNSSNSNKYIVSIAMITNKQVADINNKNQYYDFFNVMIADNFWKATKQVMLQPDFIINENKNREDTSPISNLYIPTNQTKQFNRVNNRYDQNTAFRENDFTNNYLIQAINFK